MIKVKATLINPKQQPERYNHEDTIHFGHGGDPYQQEYPLPIYQNLSTIIIITPLKSLRKITEIPTISVQEWCLYQ